MIIVTVNNQRNSLTLAPAGCWGRGHQAMPLSTEVATFTTRGHQLTLESHIQDIHLVDIACSHASVIYLYK